MAFHSQEQSQLTPILPSSYTTLIFMDDMRWRFVQLVLLVTLGKIWSAEI